MFAPENKQLLLVEEDELTLGQIQEAIAAIGYPVTPCRSPDDALSMVGTREFDMAVIGMSRSGADPLDLARALKRERAGLPLVLMAAPEELKTAVAALRLGVDDYLTLPPDKNEIRVRIGRILEARDLDTAMALLRDEIVKKTSTRELVGRSKAMKAVVDKVHRIAPMKSTVLIVGASGVGKELVARAIHYASPRKLQPFIALNCAAIPEHLIESELFGHERGAFTGAVARTKGKFELAQLGTLFLDEIGEMNPSAQVKLLRVLEEREFMRVGGTQWIRVDVRVLAATNADLERLVADGRLRRDLYFRLKVVTIQVPPLRERQDDIPVLVRQFIEQICRANNIPLRPVTPEAIAAFQSYHWPGNVRELKNLLESLLVSSPGDVLDVGDLPPLLGGAPEGQMGRIDARPGITIEEMERDLIRRTLEHTRGNRTRAAKMLQVGVRTLQRKINQFGLR